MQFQCILLLDKSADLSTWHEILYTIVYFFFLKDEKTKLNYKSINTALYIFKKYNNKKQHC